MPTVKDIIDSINDMTNEMTQEQDKKGLTPFYQKGNALIQKWLINLGFTPIDVKYLDSYYIIGRGTDAIMHFHLKEIPGFLFGLWWSGDWSENFLHAQCFAQFEKEINKFKPTRSHFCEDIYLSKEDFENEQINRSGFFNLDKMLCFMRKYPRVAWYQDVYTSSAYEYISNIKAKFLYLYYKVYKWTDKLIKRYADWRAFYYIPKIYRKDKTFHYVYQEDMYPDYEIVLINNQLKEGSYHWKNLDAPSYEKWQKAMNHFTVHINKLLHSDYWICPYDSWIEIISKEK